MDFLEGALLGPLWCDSDFENRRHRNAVLFLNIAFWVCGAYLILKANRSGAPFLFRYPAIWILILLGTFCVSPLLNFLYYDLKLLPRIGILLVQILKFGAGYALVYSIVVPRLIIRADDDFKQAVMASLNRAAEIFLDNSGLSSSSSGLVTTMLLISAAALVGLLVLGLIFMFLPILIGRLIRWIQHMIDLLFLKLTVARRRAYRAQHPFAMFNVERRVSGEPSASAIRAASVRQTGTVPRSPAASGDTPPAHT